MPGRLHVILGDQLSTRMASLKDFCQETDQILMAECVDETSYVPHHPQKIVFILSAMRHFADKLRQSGAHVLYFSLSDPVPVISFTEALIRAIEAISPDKIIVCQPGEYRVWREMQTWQERFNIPVEIRPDDRFISSPAFFSSWASGRKQLRMEFFYREMRKKTGLLMDQGKPEGGAWNFDKANRKRLPKNVVPPPTFQIEPDRTTEEVIELVKQRFAASFGAVEPFRYAVTEEEADQALQHFLDYGLPSFGDYQDAMKAGEPFLYHAVISPYLNVGLLDPLEVCQRAEAEWRAGRAPLNAVEGFIRQILGWREYVRGLYWHSMPSYAETNYFAADRPLPTWFWSGDTEMTCLAEAIGQTRDYAYAHHIQRLMVIGNFALLTGLDPKAVNEWYLAVYIDAFEWVEMPNTHGMVLYADGGQMASKPYAASGKYIDRMSDYCRHCRYSPKLSTGEGACPFNALYWDFLSRNRNKLKDNPRLGMIYRTYDKMDASTKEKLTAHASNFLAGLN